MRVGVHIKNAVDQSGGGLAALLTGAPKESFASLLDGEETVQPELKNPALLQRKQGDGGDRPSQDRRHEHARNARSSDDRVGLTGLDRAQLNTAVVEPPPALRSVALRWDSKADAQGSGVLVAQSDAASASPVEGNAAPTRGARDIGVAAPDDARAEEKTVSRVNVAPAEVPTRGSGDATGTEIPELIRSSDVPDAVAFDGFSPGPEGSAISVRGVGLAFRGDDVESGVVEGRTGAEFMRGLVVRGVRQSGGIAPAQLMNQQDLIAGGPGQHKADPATVDPQSIDSDEIRAGTAGQPDVHSAPARHDLSGQMLKAVQTTAEAPRAMEGTAVGLVRAGQTNAMQQRWVQTEGSSAKPNAAAEPSSRETGMQLAADASTSRMLANAMRGELHVGLHTEAFGHVTIQTNTAPGQFSAQVSLEDSKQSAALAAHLPAVEQRILQQHGLDASVRIISGSQTALAGGSTGNYQHGSGTNGGTREERRGSRGFGQRIGSASRLAVGETARERPGRNVLLGRLDVTV